MKTLTPTILADELERDLTVTVSIEHFESPQAWIDFLKLLRTPQSDAAPEGGKK